MNITVIGAGYVGLVTSACFAELGNHVICVDVDEKRIFHLQQGILPIYEPGLDSLVLSNMQAGRLHFVTHLSKSHKESQVIFIAVGTPSDEEGGVNISYILNAAYEIGAHIREYCVIVDKSTVPVGMADQVTAIIQKELSQRKCAVAFDVVSNPEFLREGAAILDFMQPDRVIIGLSSSRAKKIMSDLYLPILRSSERMFFMSVKDAEMTKYAANAMLATRISLMNEIALVCEHAGVDVENVRIGIGADSRIGSAFLYPGCGYGGSCFPKDIRALMKMAEYYKIDPLILQAVEKRNKLQKQLLAQKVIRLFGEDLRGVSLAVWGLAFKPGTDDMREASSLVFIEETLKRGAHIKAYDPAAMDFARKIMPKTWFMSGQLQLVEQQHEALIQADILILITEWKPFCYLDLDAMKKIMRQYIILDGRNQYDPKQLKAAGFIYEGIGRTFVEEETCYYA